MTRRVAVLLALMLSGLGGCIGDRIDGPVAVSNSVTRTGFLLREVTLPDGSTRNYSVFIPTSYDPNNPDFDFGTSDFDRRHRFVASVHYAPSWAWGIQSGLITS